MDSVPVSGAHSPSELPVGEGERAGAVGEEKDAATKTAEAVGDSEEDGEDVFEVEKILDMKTEGVRQRAGRGLEGAAAGARLRTLERVCHQKRFEVRCVMVGEGFIRSRC